MQESPKSMVKCLGQNGHKLKRYTVLSATQRQLKQYYYGGGMSDFKGGGAFLLKKPPFLGAVFIDN
jgi:hypothetical protein